VECKHEYELPALGEEMGCPMCGGVCWVSTRIPAAPAPEPRYETQAG
jgi:DNA-directed RNA polymerase subunit RPC12/RpoP